MEFQLPFKGTANQFAIATQVFVKRQRGLPTAPEVPSTNFGDFVTMKVSQKPVQDDSESLHITHHNLPSGGLLTIWARDDLWPTLRPLWEELRIELERQDWIEPQPTTTGAAPDVPTTPTSGAGKEQNEGEKVENGPTVEYWARLRKNIVKYFDDSDLHDLCFDMGIDYGDLSGQSKKDKARELVDLCRRTSRVPDLVAQLQRLRPKVSWK